MKPVIGIIARPDVSIGNNSTYIVYDEIRKSIIENNGIVIGIIPTNNQDMFSIIDKCDGLIFQGGDDFEYYDFYCLKYAYEKDIPTLGICLGMQLMGQIFNGIMYDLDNSNHKQKNELYVHNVTISKNSKLYEIFNQDRIMVNSRHQSAIKNTDLMIIGISDDGVVEALEDPKKKFFVGVQWHPESMITYDKLMNELFIHFISICRKW